MPRKSVGTEIFPPDLHLGASLDELRRYASFCIVFKHVLRIGTFEYRIQIPSIEKTIKPLVGFGIVCTWGGWFRRTEIQCDSNLCIGHTNIVSNNGNGTTVREKNMMGGCQGVFPAFSSRRMFTNAIPRWLTTHGSLCVIQCPTRSPSALLMISAKWQNLSTIIRSLHPPASSKG